MQGLATDEIRFSEMTNVQIIATYNRLASVRGADPLAGLPHGGRCELVKRTAILRATKPIPQPEPPKAKRKAAAKKKKAANGRPAPIRTYILQLLGRVDHFTAADGTRCNASNPEAVSVGLSYRKIEKFVLARFPKARGVYPHIRTTAAHARRGTVGFNCTLPGRRPRAGK